MRYIACLALCSFIAIMFFEDRALLYPTQVHAQTIGNNTVCFVPGPTDCAMVAVGEIEKAQKTLDVQQFQLTEPHVGQAIIAAKQRGVQVRLIVDKKAPTEKNGQTPAIVAAGVPTWVDYRPHIAHNKVVIINSTVIIGGSFNLTTNADRFNAENMLIIRDPAVAQAYEQNFDSRLAASEPLEQYQAEHSH